MAPTRSMQPLLLLSTALLAFVLLALQLHATVAAGDSLCSIAPASYTGAKQKYPDLKFALTAIEDYGIATWYSDRDVNDNALENIESLVATCPEASRLVVVVYGLPNKDCEGGYSNGDGSVTTADDYVEFVTQLTQAIGDRKVLYVLEPDAVGLIADGGCGVESDYEANLKLAIPLLAANKNAEIYLDVGFWTLTKTDSTVAVAQIVQNLQKAGVIKGITLNTSNYRSTDEIAALCSTFQTAVESTDMHCIVDTSRNYKVLSAAAASSEWCNKRTAGIGAPPTAATGMSNIDYFIWIKPPGDSDGLCDAKTHTEDAMPGPAAGEFFQAHFIKLWNQGALVHDSKMATIYDPTTKSSAMRIETGSLLVRAAMMTLVVVLAVSA